MGINYLCIIMEEDMEIVFEKYGKQTVCTNGVISTKQESPKIKVLSTADLFAKAIANVNEHASISDLFRVD